MADKKETPQKPGPGLEGHKKNYKMATEDKLDQSSPNVKSALTSTFKNSFDKKVVRDLPYQEVLAKIRNGGKAKDQILKARDIYQKNGKTDAYSKAKHNLPAISFCGTFGYLGKKNILSATGFIVADLDHLEDVETVRDKLSKDKHTWFLFLSPSGDGLKIGFRSTDIETDKDLKRFFFAIKRYFKEVYDLTIDEACKDISRLCYISYDPDLYINEDPLYFDVDEWVLDLPEEEKDLPPDPADFKPSPTKEKYARKVLESCCDVIRQSEPGNQHVTRRDRARLMGGYLNYMSDKEVYSALKKAVEESGAENMQAAMKTVKDGLEHGKQNPIPIPDISQNKPQILIEGGKLHEMVDQAEQVLINSNESIYQRGPTLIRPAVVEAGDYQGVKRKGSTPILQPVDGNYLADRLTRLASWKKLDARSNKWKYVDCPRRVADTLLSRVGNWNLSYIRAIIEAPTLRPDGSILETAGYDKASGLLFIPNGNFESIPESPTADDVTWAIELLKDLLKTFPFVSDEDKSVAISAILTSLVRRSLPTAPLHAFSAPAAGTGKTLLVDLCSMIATGKPAAVISQGDSDEETEKRLHTALLQGDAVINIDNVDRPLRGETMCQMLTQTVLKVRVLGKSLTIDCPSTATTFATGNNLVIAGDMARRALLCRLDAGCEKPEERQFDRNLYEYIQENRAALIKACLTILRDYQCYGYKDLNLKPMGSFEMWSTWVRGALVWAGFTDPYLTRNRILESDPVLATVRNLFHAWHDAFREKATTIKEAITEVQSDSTLREAIEAIAGTKTGINSRIFGRWMAKHQDQIVDGLRLVKDSTKNHATQWRIIKI